MGVGMYQGGEQSRRLYHAVDRWGVSYRCYLLFQSLRKRKEKKKKKENKQWKQDFSLLKPSHPVFPQISSKGIKLDSTFCWGNNAISLLTEGPTSSFIPRAKCWDPSQGEAHNSSQIIISKHGFLRLIIMSFIMKDNFKNLTPEIPSFLEELYSNCLS